MMKSNFRRKGLSDKDIRSFERWEHQIVLRSLRKDRCSNLLDMVRGLNRLLV